VRRCPQTLQDGEIRGVRYDAGDPVCLDEKRLVVVGQGAGTIEMRTLPDTNVKVIGHLGPGGSKPAEALFFEVHMPSAGIVVEYGSDDGSKPLTPGGAPQAWLATKVHDGRANAMSYSYCFADGGGFTAEYAIDQIEYTSFEGSTMLPASRAVQFVYGTKDPADVRFRFSGGMKLQSSLRLDEIQMVGPGNELVRRYALGYTLGPTTKRTLLAQIEECSSDGGCKPATHFQYKSSAPGFKRLPTSIPAPTSTRASPMLLDLDGSGFDSLVVGDTDKALSTPTNPIPQWLVAPNRGPNASPPYFSTVATALTEDWPMVAMPSGPADPASIQPEVGTAIDYDQDGLTDLLLHDVAGVSPNWIVLLAQPGHTFKQHDTGIARPFPLGVSPLAPTLTSTGASVHLADLDGDSVPDLIECQDHDEAMNGDPSAPAWTVHLWRPAQGGAPAGFDPAGETIDPLAGYPCDGELYTVDINADGKVDLLQGTGGTQMLPAGTYNALTRLHDGTWEVFDTKLPIVPPGGRVVFLDVNADGLPDAVESGLDDHMLWTWINTGPTFTLTPGHSLPSPVTVLAQDAYFGLAVVLDFNGDGKQDLLVPVPGGTLPGKSDAIPAWAILQATGSTDGATFELVDRRSPSSPCSRSPASTSPILTGPGSATSTATAPRIYFLPSTASSTSSRARPRIRTSSSPCPTG
jgi:hypothetical protein